MELFLGFLFSEIRFAETKLRLVVVDIFGITDFNSCRDIVDNGFFFRVHGLVSL
jgi:hypothetical protein